MMEYELCAKLTTKQQQWTEKAHANPWVFEYNMEKKGRALIFNNIAFDDATGMTDRDGAEDDAEGLFDAFKGLNFSVTTHVNCTIKHTKKCIKKASGIDYKQFSCLVIVFMSHGEQEDILYATDGKLFVDELTHPFKGNACPSLAGKPKLFFIQACRGYTRRLKFDEAVEIDTPTDEPDFKPQPQEYRQTIPSEADVLLAYACPPRYFALKNDDGRAWFIEALEFVLKTYATKEIEIQQLLTRVCHLVAYEYELQVDSKDVSGKKQVPYIVSTLTKALYFRAMSEE